MDYVASEDFKTLNAEITAAVNAREQGERVALLVNGDRYAEVIAKKDGTVTLQYPNRYTEQVLAELQAAGWKAVAALRIVKADGTWMYCVVMPEGTDWYIAGKKFPAIRGKSWR